MVAKAGTMMNDHMPDIAKLFAEKVRVDLKEPDVEARILKYFIDFDQVVEDEGLSKSLGRQTPSDNEGYQRMKTKVQALGERRAA